MPRSLRSLVNVRRVSGLARRVAASPDWFRVIPAYFGITKPTFPHDIRLRNGIRITTWHPKEIITAWIVLFSDEYGVDPDARVIVDAGANIGAFSLFAASRAPHASIFAIELSKPTFDCLNHNVAQTTSAIASRRAIGACGPRRNAPNGRRVVAEPRSPPGCRQCIRHGKPCRSGQPLHALRSREAGGALIC